jgi:hypothetical protein
MERSAMIGGGKGWRIAGWAMVAAALAVPLVAMPFTQQVAWSVSDFILMGLLLGGAGLALEFVARRTGDRAYRGAVAVALAGCLALVVINGAVGIIGSEREDANLLFGAVIAVGLIGAIVTRLQASGMRLVMTGMAVAQTSVPVIAYAAMPGVRGALVQPEVTGATVVFVIIWLVSGWLFRMAAR